jgi:hypothetical protein
VALALAPQRPSPPLFSARDWNGEGLIHFAVLYPSDNLADVVC